MLECLEIRSTIESQQINQENTRCNKYTKSKYQVKVFLQVDFDALSVGYLSANYKLASGRNTTSVNPTPQKKAEQTLHQLENELDIS